MVIGQEYSHFSRSTNPQSTGCHVRTLVSMASRFARRPRAKLSMDLARRAHLRVGRRWSGEHWQKRQELWPTDKVAFDAGLSEFCTALDSLTVGELGHCARSE